MKLRLILILALTVACGAMAQTNSTDGDALSDFIGTVQEWAEENLDEDFLAALGGVDQQQVESFLARFQEELGGDYVLDLAALKEAASAVLPLLEAHEETQPYAAWLRSRLDYFDTAQTLKTVAPAPKPQPGRPTPRPANPTPEQGRKVWTKTLEQRPLPKGAEKLVPQLKQIFASERVPTELVWLAEVESSFDRRARSPAGAAGLFQLMPVTAERFELRRWPFDQRYQVEPSARAAARYLRVLHGQFKDWPLAVAAYNAGEGRVGSILAARKARSFDAIARQLPAETQMYVPKVEATLLRREGVKLGKLPAPRK